jgi:ribosomal protein L32
MRHTRAHTKNRRSHHALSAPAVSIEAKDGEHLRHRVSPITGKYKGAQILDLSKKETKKSQRIKDKKESKTSKEDKPKKEAKVKEEKKEETKK